MDVTISGLPPDTGNKKDHFHLWVSWKDDSFDIKMVCKNQSWQGNASREHLKQLSQPLNLSVEDYLNETRTALSTQGGTSQFSYHIADNQFIWKKVVQNNIKIKFGYVCLEETDFQETMSVIVEDLLTKNTAYQIEINKLQKENNQAAEDKALLMNKLVEYKKQKLEMENSLFSQFLVVLNRKKQVMQHTSEDNHNNGTSSIQQSTNHYDSDTEVEEDTDDEKNNENAGNISVDWFEDKPEPTAFLPKRTGHKKRASEQATEKPGPSGKKPLKRVPPSESTDSQDLMDDF